MKKIIAVCLIVVLLSGCARPMTICGVTYDSYGFFNQEDEKNPNIKYRPVWGNIFWGAVLGETVIAPIYFFGFSLFEPVGLKTEIKGSIGESGQCERRLPEVGISR